MVDATIKAFSQQQLNSTLSLLTSTLFAFSLSENSTLGSGLAEFLVTPLLASCSDKLTRKRVLQACFLGIFSLRSSSLILRKLKVDYLQLDAFHTSLVGGLVATMKASIADFCQDATDLSICSAQIAAAGAAGSFMSQIVRGVASQITNPYFVEATSVAVPLGCACAITVMMDDYKEPQIPPSSSTDDSILSYSPLSFTRLATSGSGASYGMICSGLMEVGGGLALTELFELSKTRFPLASQRLRFSLGLALASIAGTLYAREIQKKFGLEDQASVATVGQVSTAIALWNNRPFLAILCSFFAMRGQDATDSPLIMNRQDGGGRGETVASLANWKSFISLSSSLGIGFLKTSSTSVTGENNVFIICILCSILAEYLRRRQQRQKDLDSFYLK